MKLLCFQAKRFRWKSHSKTLPEVEVAEVETVVEEALVAFVQVEVEDGADETRARVFRHTLKHLKWLANKRDLRRIVLHSFAHLGGQNAPPSFASTLFQELSDRLESTGYEVHQTPFGYFCEWDLSVHGDSLAKVWKEI